MDILGLVLTLFRGLFNLELKPREKHPSDRGEDILFTLHLVRARS